MGHLTIWTSNNYFADNSKLIETNHYIYIYIYCFSKQPKYPNVASTIGSLKNRNQKKLHPHLAGLRNSKLMADERKVKGSCGDMTTPYQVFWKYLSIIGTLLWYIWSYMAHARGQGSPKHQPWGVLPSTIGFPTINHQRVYIYMYLFMFDVFFWQVPADSDRFDVWWNQNWIPSLSLWKSPSNKIKEPLIYCISSI